MLLLDYYYYYWISRCYYWIIIIIIGLGYVIIGLVGLTSSWHPLQL